MLLIILSWCYVLITLVNFGFVATSIASLQTQNKLLHVVLGLISILVISHIWAFFDGFGILFHSGLLFLNVVISIVFWQKLRGFFSAIFEVLLSFSRTQQVLLASVVLLILAKSASQGSFLDNENYYIQTIQWFNEYGFVSGLANFNLFLGQSSGWHVLQSAFSFYFLDVDFNDLGGLLLLLLNVYALKHANEYKSSFYFLVWIPVLNFFMLELCVIPSPDFGIIFFGFMLCYLFLKSYSQPTEKYFYLVLLLFLSAIIIKITAIGLLVFPLVLLYKLKVKSLSLYFKSTVLVLVFGSIWIGKNLVISGYPLFPSASLSDFISLQHQIPEAVYNLSLRNEKLLEFFATTQDVERLSTFDLIWKWFTYSRVSMLFNLSILVLVFGIPILIARFKLGKEIWWIYLSFVAQLIFLAFTSPKYRFALHYLLIFILIFLSCIPINLKFKRLTIGVSQVFVLLMLVFPIQFGQLPSKSYLLNTSPLQLKNLVFPAQNSSLSTVFQTYKLGNFRYQSPEEEVYIYTSGDGNLPCINKRQLMRSIQYSSYVPQLLDSVKLSKGFYSEKIILPNPIHSSSER